MEARFLSPVYQIYTTCQCVIQPLNSSEVKTTTDQSGLPRAKERVTNIVQLHFDQSTHSAVVNGIPLGRAWQKVH